MNRMKKAGVEGNSKEVEAAEVELKLIEEQEKKQ